MAGAGAPWEDGHTHPAPGLLFSTEKNQHMTVPSSSGEEKDGESEIQGYPLLHARSRPAWDA